MTTEAQIQTAMEQIYWHGTVHVEQMSEEEYNDFWLGITDRGVRYLFREMNQRIELKGFESFRMTRKEVDDLITFYCKFRQDEDMLEKYLVSSSVRISVIAMIEGALNLRMVDEIVVGFTAKCMAIAKKYNHDITGYM